MSRYQLRHAAGRYWLLDMEQDGLAYRPPVCLNEGGAYIWERLSEGCQEQEIVSLLGRRYGLSEEEAGGDVSRFVEQLEQRGIQIPKKRVR